MSQPLIIRSNRWRHNLAIAGEHHRNFSDFPWLAEAADANPLRRDAHIRTHISVSISAGEIKFEVMASSYSVWPPLCGPAHTSSDMVCLTRRCKRLAGAVQ